MKIEADADLLTLALHSWLVPAASVGLVALCWALSRYFPRSMLRGPVRKRFDSVGANLVKRAKSAEADREEAGGLLVDNDTVHPTSNGCSEL